MVQKRNKRPALLHHLIYSGVREWSLITGRGGESSYTPTGGGGGRAEKVLTMLKRVGIKCFQVVLTWELEVLAVLVGGTHKVSTL